MSIFRKILIIFLFFTHFGFAQQFNLPLLSRWDDDAIPLGWYGAAYSECWGYDHNGREYAFLASNQGTYFFDITDAKNPVQVGFFRTKDTTELVLNKDYAVYSHYLYAVSDQGENSLQIFDLQYLPDSVVKVYDSDYKSKRCHTIFVEHNRLYMCSNTRYDNSFGAMDIFTLANPVNPLYLGTVWNSGFFNVHEVYVRNDTAYCANGYDGMWIYDVADPANPVLLSIIELYDEHGFNHSGWLSDDSKAIAFTDEDHGKGIKLFDISDLTDPQPISLFRSNLLQVADPESGDGSIAHNPYIVGNILFVSYYHDGVVAFDITNTASPKLVGYFDTYPENTSYASYKGCWGLYPFLPSGNIIASDMTNGLFILDGKQILHPGSATTSVNVLKNPVDDEIEFIYYNGMNQPATVSVFDIRGALVMRKETQLSESSGTFSVPFKQAATGIYIAKITTGDQDHSIKILKAER